MIRAFSGLLVVALSAGGAAWADGDVTKGRELAETHCARCHVVGNFNKFGGIGSTPSFNLIVGMDEVDPPRNRVSWIAPVSRALLKARIGDVVTFESPRGREELEIVDVRYEAIEQ